MRGAVGMAPFRLSGRSLSLHFAEDGQHQQEARPPLSPTVTSPPQGGGESGVLRLRLLPRPARLAWTALAAGFAFVLIGASADLAAFDGRGIV